MLTAKDIREVKFNRAMGGYKTAEVDEFLDRCADVVEELTAQCEENERKMQVLAETIVDYRNQEDSIRSALISAQRMSESVIADARKQANDILDAANSEAVTLHKQAVKEIASEQEELRRIRQEVADFKAKLMSIYREHLTLIGVLEGADSAEDVVAAHATDEDVKQVPMAKASGEPLAERAAFVYEDNEFVDTHELPDFSSFVFK